VTVPALYETMFSEKREWLEQAALTGCLRRTVLLCNAFERGTPYIDTELSDASDETDSTSSGSSDDEEFEWPAFVPRDLQQ